MKLPMIYYPFTIEQKCVRNCFYRSDTQDILYVSQMLQVYFYSALSLSKSISIYYEDSCYMLM